ncbi:hypothetical protein BC936DRAFT_148937 [Jimgerdemannia flammicorona]|uniref:Uncharacterized protein n=1 Tax=Jimgerdemannia flammicorona TaxID=994334 RepID=A0A433D1Z7_9FUNG|nr:hypothetical protein BC936DRAFT_148937 [Jimgerdemannia flammicorona]
MLAVVSKPDHRLPATFDNSANHTGRIVPLLPGMPKTLGPDRDGSNICHAQDQEGSHSKLTD